ncbi:hypothetical protein [Amycolatopsis sp. H20-H5]|uniref:hypothetical protein n=1 Tax=Amycolatopsis sp. H20-H5 TaxID=3046309 RepID=UPI002DBEF136|nr:hypothetical protein [Amycolatopsis sp. H20-H5]MEC3981293.1 hypothetical protein [Amycolatopsis sp. H20-H5]
MGRHHTPDGDEQAVQDAMTILGAHGVSRDAARVALDQLARERGVSARQSAVLLVDLVGAARG